MEDLIGYECLRCRKIWVKPADQDPLAQCPGCRTTDYDTPKSGEGVKICVVCEREYPGTTSAHGIQGACPGKCSNKLSNHRRRQTGVFI